MKKHDILLATTAILSCAILAESVRAEIKSEVSCGGKCTYYYDTVTHDMRWEKNADVGADEEVILRGSSYNIPGKYGLKDVNNLTIGEGITGLGYDALWSYAGYSLGNSNSTLVLPSTLKSNVATTGDQAIHYVLFGTIDASALKDADMYIQASSNLHTLIVDQNSSSVIKIGAGYGSYPTSVTIQCKGDKTKCQSQVQRVSNTTTFTPEYYSGPDGNGNWEEWSDDGKAVYADSTKAKPLATYGFDGKQTASYNYNASGLLLSANTYDAEGNVVGSYNYTYDAGGNLVSAYQNGKAVYLRKRYTIPEADAATQGKGPFRLDITW